MNYRNTYSALEIKSQGSLAGIPVSEVTLVYKSKVANTQRPRIIRSHEAVALFRTFWCNDTIELIEQFKIIYLNSSNRVLGIYNLSSGGINSTIADPKLIFCMAVKLCATAIVLCHNHPSGNLKPSPEDESLTANIKQIASCLDIRLQDHLIINSEGYFSFFDEDKL